MLINTTNAKRCLKEFDFRALFIEELGWDRHTSTLQVAVDAQTVTLSALANKRGMDAYLCAPSRDGHIPDYPTRRKIEMQTAKAVREHLIIYTDADKTTQVWQWVKREAGKPLASREHTFHRNQSGDALIQKLQAIVFSIAEEETLTLVDVTSRVRAGFDLERVTKRFYDRFKTEHDAFLKFIDGIPDEEMERWYVSVMLNRLMFIYFIQKKGFLDGDTNYLRNRLAESKKRGKDRFYRDFLCPLFFEGFAKKEQERSAGVNALLGQVPYLNGGIFQQHQIEELHGKAIQIPDAAFARLFDFFDQYQWHLDERPLRADNEINPDVLGYIFEKYINQKQMGAYYTKEDITGYISQNTVIPFLFDAAWKTSEVSKTSEVWPVRLRTITDWPVRKQWQRNISNGLASTPAACSPMPRRWPTSARPWPWNIPRPPPCTRPSVICRRSQGSTVRRSPLTKQPPLFVSQTVWPWWSTSWAWSIIVAGNGNWRKAIFRLPWTHWARRGTVESEPGSTPTGASPHTIGVRPTGRLVWRAGRWTWPKRPATRAPWPRLTTFWASWPGARAIWTRHGITWSRAWP